MMWPLKSMNQHNQTKILLNQLINILRLHLAFNNIFEPFQTSIFFQKVLTSLFNKHHRKRTILKINDLKSFNKLLSSYMNKLLFFRFSCLFKSVSISQQFSANKFSFLSKRHSWCHILDWLLWIVVKNLFYEVLFLKVRFSFQTLCY